MAASEAARPSEALINEETLLIAAKLRTLARDDRAAISVCSLDRSEGVSRVVAGLAEALARQTEQRVLIIDADLNRPSQHRRFDVPESPGLAEALLTEASISEAVHPTAMESLYVLPAGSTSGDPNFVYSVEYSRMLATLRDQFQIILIDTPPLDDSGAGYLLASRSESVLLVMASGRHPRRELRKVSSELARLGTKVLGVCLTETES